MKESFFLIVMLISAVLLVAGIVLLVISIRKTAKGKKKNIAGIICGSLLSVIAFFGIIYGIVGMLILAMVPAVESMVSEVAGMSTEFTTVPGSRTIPGNIKINGDEIKLPCTIAELKSKGYETDYKYSDNMVMFWSDGDSEGGNERSYFYAYLADDSYYGYADTAEDNQLIAAIELHDDDKTAFQLNGIHFGMSKDDFINKTGSPALEKHDPALGDTLYYLGDNGLMYRFHFSYHTLHKVTAGTPEYMEKEAMKE